MIQKGSKIMSQEKKDLIRQAAVKVIARDGYYNTKTAKIAEEANVAVGTIYNYFDSKDDILEYIFRVEFEKRISYLKKVEKKDMTIYEKLSFFIEKHFNEVKNNLDTAQILVREKEFPKTSEFSSILVYLNDIPALLEEMLRKAIKKGEIRQQNISITAGLIFGGLQGVVEKALRTGNIEMLDHAEEEIMKFIKYGA